MIETFIRDLRYESRQLAAKPGFTAAVVLTLVLGVGFVTTLFTMINGIAYSKLPFPDAGKIVAVGIPANQYDAYALHQEALENIAFFQQVTANLRVKSYAVREPAVVVSSNFFDVLPARAARGRTFTKSDGAAAAERSVIIGHKFWEREFLANPNVLGSIIMINGQSHTVIGVMPAGFAFPFNQQIWVVRRAAEAIPNGMVFGRLGPQISAQEASTRLSAIANGLEPAPGVVRSAPVTIQVREFTKSMVKDPIRIMLIAILSATFLVLILACANVTNLVLARAVERRKELAIRAALGASRGRLVRQMLTENLLLISAGAIGGLAVAWLSTRAIWSYMIREGELTGGVPYWMNFNVDGWVLSFVLAVAILCSLITGLLPALQISRVDLNDALKAGSRGSLRLSRLSRLLVNAQMAFSVCLVTVAALFLAILHAYSQKTLPYDPGTVLTAQVALEGPQYESAATRTRLFGELIARLGSAAGVEAVGLNSSQSLRSAPQLPFELEGKTYQRDDDRPVVTSETVSVGFIQAMNARVHRGRNFSNLDSASSAPVAMVNTAFVSRYSGGDDLVGRRLRVAADESGQATWATIVGIAPDLGSMKAGRSSAGPVVYRPLAQVPERTMTLLVRTRGDAIRLSNSIRREASALDQDLPVSRIQTVSEILELERIGMNAFGSLFVLCGIGALALATIGIYGVISFSVRMRVREFGVRLALGSTSTAVVLLVMRQGVRQIAVGLGIGVVLAAMASMVLNSAIEGFTRTTADIWIYAGVATLLGIVGATALAIPALRAARVDPMVALRTE